MQKIKLFKLFVAGVLLTIVNTIFIACSANDSIVPSNPINLNFAETTLRIAETKEEHQITINLNGSAPVSGSVTVTLGGTASYGDDYTTTPAGNSGSFLIEVAEGDQSVSFTLIPIDDETVEADKNIVFTLSSAEEKLRIGSDNKLTVTLTSEDAGNPDDPIELVFSTDNLTVAESDGTQEITINFSNAAPIDGIVTVALSGTATYGEDYTTVPEGVSGSITLNISEDDVNASLSITIINDSDTESEESIKLILTSDNDKLTIGQANMLDLLLTDDDDYEEALMIFDHNTMYSVDVSNGSITEVNTITLEDGSGLTNTRSFVYDRESQKGFLGVGHSSDALSELYSLNIATGEATLLNDNDNEIAIFGGITGLLIDDNQVIVSANYFTRSVPDSDQSGLLWFNKISGEQGSRLDFDRSLTSSGLIYDENREHVYLGGVNGFSDSKTGVYYKVNLTTGLTTEQNLSVTDPSNFGVDFSITDASIISFANDQTGNEYVLFRNYNPFIEGGDTFLAEIDFSTGVLSHVTTLPRGSGIFWAMGFVPEEALQE